MYCSQNLGHKIGGAIFMSKLTREDKIEIYERNKNGETIASLAKAFNVNKIVLHYLIRLIRKHGYDVLGNGKNKHYLPTSKHLSGLLFSFSYSSPASIILNSYNLFLATNLSLCKK